MIDHLKQDRWFVDVRGQVSGPFSSWDIIQKLVAGELKVIHRVSRDNHNWKGLCNEEYFENAILTAIDYYSGLSGESSNKDNQSEDIDEETGFGNLSGISAGIQSQLSHAQSLQEINVGLNSLRKLHSDLLHHKKTVIEAKPTVQDEIHPEDRNVYVGMETVDPDANFFKRNKFLTAVLVMGVCILGGLKYLERQNRLEQAAINEQILKIQKAKALEGYEKALGSTDSMSSAELIKMAQDEIEKDNLSFSEKLLERALEVAHVGPDKAKAHSLLGYIATQENDMNQATLSYEASLKSSQKMYLSYHNYGLIKLQMGALEDAEAMFLKALELDEGPADRTPTYFALLEVAIMLDKLDNEKAKTKLLKENKDGKFVPSFPRMDKAAVFIARAKSPYLREQILAETYIDFIREPQKLNKPKILQFLKVKDEDLQPKPRITGLDVSRMKWSHLYSWCLPIYNADRKSVQLNAFFGYCVLRARDAVAAKPYIDFAVQKASHDPLYKRYAELLEKQGKADESESTSASMRN